MTIEIAEYIRLDQPRLLAWLRQCGVNDAVLRLPEDATGMPSDADSVEAAVRRTAEAGFTVRVIEPLPPFEKIKQGLPGRDREVEMIHDLLRTMDRLDIRILCHNFMAAFGWGRTRTSVEGRGGATVTGFDVDDLAELPAHEPSISEAQMWENYAYFLDAVLPVAEEHGISLAMHPDDPPISPFRGIARIMTSVDALEKAMAMGGGSPAQGLTFCQGTITTMGADVSQALQRLGDHVRFVHFRDIVGSAERFSETFHDEGRTDMAAALRAYVDAGYQGYMRSDHVPTLTDEANDHPGYGELGRLFAVGYMRGLLDAISPR